MTSVPDDPATSNFAIAVVLLVAGGGFYMYQSGALSGGSKDVNVEIKLPTPPAATE